MSKKEIRPQLIINHRTINYLNTLLGNENNFNWELFKEYVNTYDIKQHSYGDRCTFEDMLYGIAISLDSKYKTFDYLDGYKLFKQQLKEWLSQNLQSEPCSNCKETTSQCACMRNGCIRCGKPVGNITFTVCDDCWSL